MHRVGLVKREGGNFHVEITAVLAHHLIRAAHDASGGFELAARGVLKGLTWGEYRLFADDTGALVFLHVPRSVGDDPVTAQKLDRVVAFVCDPDGVIEQPLALKRL